MNLWVRSLCFLDRLFGFRAWGIYLYGILPANLALIGVLEVKNVKVGESTWPVLICVSIIPLLIVFLFIRNKHREWYLYTRLSNVRSILTTIIVLAAACCICGCAGIIKDKYEWGFPENENLRNWEAWSAMVESFLMGLASLVLTSTFFMAMLVKDMNIPGVPPKEVTEMIRNLRMGLMEMMNVRIWEKGDLKKHGEVLDIIERVKVSCRAIMNTQGNYFVKKAVEVLENDVDQYKRLVQKFKDGGNDAWREWLWRVCFGQEANLSGEEKVRRAKEEQKLASLNRIRSLRLGN